MTQAQKPEYFDTVVIGAGFGGLQMLHEMKEAGKTVKAFEAGSDVGGTWYWNRYPGARTDSESWGYCFSFSKELHEEWTWSERLPKQEEVLRYLQHVAERFDLRRHISFNNRVLTAHFDDNAQQWSVTTEQGDHVRCKYLVSATGVLSLPKQLEFPGIERFKGEHYFAPLWPKHPVSFKGKRVAIIGSAATAVQLLPIVAQTAGQVYYFQRTPNYVLPGRNYNIESEEVRSLKDSADEVFARRRNHVFGLPMTSSGRTYDSVTDEQRQRIFEAGWEDGGFHFCFETFDDILTDPRSNEAASEFIRNKIRSIVKDPATAEALCPHYTLFAKRPPSGHFYYEAFNRPNVKLVDIKDDPIKEVTETGLATGKQSFDVDMIIFATGFDAGTGPMLAMDVRGAEGVTLRSKWADGAQTYLGLMVEQLPNLFMIMGPQSPFGNIPTLIEGQVEWIMSAVKKADVEGGVIEPTAAAVQAWYDHLNEVYNATLLATSGVGAWFIGTNIPGKPFSVLFYFGGVGAYLDRLVDDQSKGLPDLTVRPTVQAGPQVAQEA